MQSPDKKQYYDRLLDKAIRYPSPNPHQIEVDLHRTFPEDPFFQEPENLKTLERVLTAYSLRNPNIGYCQGFNFIVGRLLKIMNEEVSKN